jgi:hypothetical protein
MDRIAVNLILLATLAIGGCGAMVTDYPNRLIGVDGQGFYLEDLEEIAGNENLTDDEKRERFRELGIQDDDLIEALLAL